MKNFQKVSFESVNGVMNVAGQLYPRSLVLVNERGTAYNIQAKVRNTDKFFVIKALGKALLASMREANTLNSTEAAQTSKKRVINPITPALSSFAILVTDKEGKMLQNSVLSVTDGGKLRSVIRITKSMPVYKLIVEQGAQFGDDAVTFALNAWVKATIEQLNYVANLDEALLTAANSNEKEAEKAEKKNAKAEKAEKAEKAA